MSEWVSKYFKRHEFQCDRPERPCECGLDNIHPTLPSLADEVRGHLGVPIEVLSGVRCIEGNRVAGGRSRSFHIPRLITTGEIDDIDGLGLAADFSFQNRSLRTRENVCRLYMLFESFGIKKYCKTMGLGLYDWGVHCDLRGHVVSKPGRWNEIFWGKLG